MINLRQDLKSVIIFSTAVRKMPYTEEGYILKPLLVA